ncbi:sugar transferase [Anaerovorax odorimutans]|uniref:Sugar transferase n=1 Tax=Anaerovorax odorimutans TaxID=109327 RepID=A0ABT1RJD0_9FIRM|nr:sugar transferase [Anaerovorax odorimutans]MCQ4635288.1 sugar transferase [Anaerovorax odorimutans]
MNEFMQQHQKGFYEKYIKRPLGFCCALIAVVLLSWFMVIIAVLVKLKLGSPIIFKQERPGLNEEIFTLYKFRTMNNQTDEKGNLLPDDVRLTKFGRFLRSLSIDELPELFNILKGDMAIVGPRPLAVIYLPYYSKLERQRHSVRPGLSGLAQVNGRNSISWEKKFEFDIEYVNNISFINDLLIVMKTIRKVFARSDIGQGEEHPGSLHIERQNKKNDDM